jgi:hypothetical protein
MARLWGRRLFLIAAWLFVLGLLYQVYLAGMGVFAGSFDTHAGWGNYVIGPMTIVLFVLALIGRVGRLDIALTVLLFVQGAILQSVFILQRDTSPAIAALHPVNGVLMLIIGIYLGVDAWRMVRAERAAAA